jgi:hydroxyethylthiazole kinase-like uncharacterized protein yjeF
MFSLPQALYGAAQTRELDRIAIEECSLSGATLMQRAGERAFRHLQAHWPRARRIAVLCGAGNNGGDGYVLARAAAEAGLEVSACAFAEPRSTESRAARDAAAASGVGIVSWDGRIPEAADVVVDALFGTGLERDVAGDWRAAVEAANGCGRPVLALDIPSGLHADSGRVLGVAIQASVTVSFIGLKLGLFTGAGRACTGVIRFEGLGVPEEIYAKVAPLALRTTADRVRGLLPARAADAHKGSNGRVLIVGGELGMPGAARMAAEAAYRTGAGLVSVATRAAHAAAISAGRAEIICRGVELAADLRGILNGADVVAVGPGLGQGDWSQALWATVLDAGGPLVVDADALNLLAQDPLRRDDWVLTPHPGEAARLLGLTPSEVQHDRLAAVRAVVERYGGVCVLKGSGSLVAAADHGRVSLCDRGNPGMASGGMGDVLTGVIAGLLAQGIEARAGAEAAVWLHAATADRTAVGGQRGLLAGDVIGALREELGCLGA